MDPNEAFHKFASTATVRTDLRATAVRAFGYTLTSAGCLFALRIASTAILARLLTPEDFGLFMMVTAVTAIADNLRDLGLSTATIQRHEISRAEASNLFWINACAGLAICLAMSGSSPVVAYVFKEQRLVSITIVLSLIFVFAGLTVQHQALLTRQMKHGHKSLVQVAAFIVSSIAAVFLALHGFAVWALVLRELLQSFLVLFGISFLCPWIPAPPNRKVSVWPMLRFGRDMTASQIIGAIASSLDRFLLGRFFGPASVALYRQPFQLVAAPINQFMGPLYQISLPSLSMLQSDPARFSRFFCKITTIVSMASMPLGLYLAVFSNEITLLILGDSWQGAAIFFRIFAIGAFFRAISSIPGFVLVSRGHSRTLVTLTILNSAVMATLMCLALPWGPPGLAIAETVTILVMLYPRMRLSFRDSPVTIAAFLAATLRPVASSLAMAASLVAVRWIFPLPGVLPNVIVGAVIALPAYAAVWLCLPGGFAEGKALFSDALSGLRWRG